MNAEHQLKSKLALPVCSKSMQLKQNGTWAMTTAKSEVFWGVENCYLVGELMFDGGE